MEPASSSTASETKFSLAIISSPSCWRKVSWSTAAATSGSAWARERAMRSVIQEFYGIGCAPELWKNKSTCPAMKMHKVNYLSAQSPLRNRSHLSGLFIDHEHNQPQRALLGA